MASKDCKRVELMPLRTTRRSKIYEKSPTKATGTNNEVQDPISIDHNNQIQQPKEQQVSPKNEKQSTNLLNNQQLTLVVADEPARRITRSAVQVCKKNQPQINNQEEQITPEDNPKSKVEEQPTIKKFIKISSVVSLSQPASYDLASTVKKPMLKPSQSVTSPYSEIRKSYRKIHRREIISIPYRKCHDAFEGRIVTIINKVQSGKNCLRDFQSLIERMQRISGKDMINRFIIAGIKTIIKLGREKNIYDIKLMERLEREEGKLKLRIIEELDKMEDFQQCQFGNKEELIECLEYKKKLVKKIYRLMKVHGGMGSVNEVKQRAMKDCEKYFDAEVNVGSLIKFVKQRTDISVE